MSSNSFKRKAETEENSTSEQCCDDLKNGDDSNSKSEIIGNNNIELPTSTENSVSNLVKETTKNITNILNLGQDVLDEDMENDEKIKNSPSKCASACKCKHRCSKHSHSRKKVCRHSKSVSGGVKHVEACRREYERRHSEGEHMSSGYGRETREEMMIGHELIDQLNYGKDYHEMYESPHDSFYDQFTKSELVDRWIKVEDDIEHMDKVLNDIRERKKLMGFSGVDLDSEYAKIEVFREEINKLIEENNELYQSNETLKNYLNNS